MSLTILQAKAVLGRKLGPLVGLADMDEALRSSLGYLGLPTADPVVPADVDLLPITQAQQITQLYLVAVWQALQSMLLNLTADDLIRQGVTDPFDDVYATLRTREERAREFVMKAYSIGLPTLTAGVVSLEEDEPRNEFGACR